MSSLAHGSSLNTQTAYPWDVPLYATSFAGRLVGLNPSRVRRWLQGYEYTYTVQHDQEPRHTRQEPVVVRHAEEPYATFLDLVDLLFIKSFLDHGITLQRLRKALGEVAQLFGGHHFAQRSFFTAGHNIYIQIRNRDADSLLQLLSGGQWAIGPVIRKIGHKIDFHESTGFAERWYPLGRDGRVVVDPLISFGAPVLVGKGIETANVYDLFVAEQENAAAVASWMELQVEEVEAATRFELSLEAA